MLEFIFFAILIYFYYRLSIRMQKCEERLRTLNRRLPPPVPSQPPEVTKPPEPEKPKEAPPPPPPPEPLHEKHEEYKEQKEQKPEPPPLPSPSWEKPPRESTVFSSLVVLIKEKKV